MIVNNTLEMLKIKNNFNEIENIINNYCDVKDAIDVQMQYDNKLFYLVVRWNNLKDFGIPELYAKTFNIYQNQTSGEFFLDARENLFDNKHNASNFKKEVVNEINNILKQKNKDDEKNI